MSLFDLQDVCIAIGSLATLDLPMVVDLIGIYGLKGPRFTMIRWASPKLLFRRRNGCGPTASCIPEPLRVTQDLMNVLNEMVHEYRKPSQAFEEIKSENNGLKNSSVEPITAQLGETDSLQTGLSKLKIENDSLRIKSCELSYENARLNHVMSSWTKYSVYLSKLHETQKPLNDKSGLGFSFGESSSEKTSTQSNPANDKFKKMNFVKASVTHDVCESVKYDDQFTGQLNHKGKNGMVTLSLRTILTRHGTTIEASQLLPDFENPAEPCSNSTSLPKLETTRNAHPETQTSKRTNELLCTKTPQLRTSSPMLIQGFKWVAIERATHNESSATKITQIIGEERRKSKEDMFG
ncbi:hypothetical protein F511_36540 [Dorcoceras hygrometricum]|uniref:Uncharacterized protein n=1 Tax=Dorcoceras hygrometricum TaxID=472368 RepID=A0A2Z7AP85_9LAMI|nr:hypothetical protein F511_36540 [Dorcoceras hygrometricum]